MRTLIRLFIVLAVLMTSGSVVPGQTPATSALMREKLIHAEKVLEAIMTSNFGLLDRESAALSHVTRAPGWDVLKTPQYARYSAQFVRAAEDLTDAATTRDLDAAVVRYMSLTLACHQCHRYMKDARMAR